MKPAAKKKPAPGKSGASKAPKGPSKKLLEALKQAQSQQNEALEQEKREEEERIRQEEEEKRRQEEEEKRKLEEKEKKKQREKEKKERLKKEGKLLNPKQKADRKRAMESALFRKQQLAGVIDGTIKLEIKDKSKEESDSSGDEDFAQPTNGLSTNTSDTSQLPDGQSFRSPVICVLGHVDTGKTKLLDFIRRTHVQDNEAGGITQQIGATFVPDSAIKEQTKAVKTKLKLMLPGLLIIDTPGHESFTNLRLRGSSLCDIAILVIDITKGLEQQTIESIGLLKERKTPFVVALNKIDRLYNWRSNPHKDVEDLLEIQAANTKQQFNDRSNDVILQLAQQGLNAKLYYKNEDPRTYVSLVPTSAVTGDGMGNLISMLITFSQTMLMKKIIFKPDDLNATVFEVKALQGLGTTLDVILINGTLREGDKIVLAGIEGAIVTQIRALLVPHPLRELRVKAQYTELKSVNGSIGVKVTGHDLEKAIAGLQLHVAKTDDEVERLKTYCMKEFDTAMNKIKCVERGVYVQASTLGSLEALLEFLKQSKIPYSNVRIGPVVRKDVMKISTMLQHEPTYACILAFDVKIERDAQELADQMGIKIFQAEIIYHLFDKFTAHLEEVKKKQREQFKSVAVFPCKLKILPNCIFNKRDPIVIGVEVLAGKLKQDTPIWVLGKDILIGRVTSMQINHVEKEIAKVGDEVCIKIENMSSDAPKMIGRHFEETDTLMSHISRESIDAVKNYFRDDLDNSDWKLMVELKNTLKII